MRPRNAFRNSVFGASKLASAKTPLLKPYYRLCPICVTEEAKAVELRQEPHRQQVEEGCQQLHRLSVVQKLSWGAREGGRTLRKDVFLPSKHLLSAFYETLPSKNPF